MATYAGLDRQQLIDQGSWAYQLKLLAGLWVSWMGEIRAYGVSGSKLLLTPHP